MAHGRRPQQAPPPAAGAEAEAWSRERGGGRPAGPRRRRIEALWGATGGIANVRK